MVGNSSRNFILIVLCAGMICGATPIHAVSMRTKIRSSAKITLAKLKKFLTFDYLRHCDCPEHKKNQTLKNQIRRHPERLGIYLAAGAGFLFGSYKLFATDITNSNLPGPPIPRTSVGVRPAVPGNPEPIIVPSADPQPVIPVGRPIDPAALQAPLPDSDDESDSDEDAPDLVPILHIQPREIPLSQERQASIIEHFVARPAYLEINASPVISASRQNRQAASPAASSWPIDPRPKEKEEAVTSSTEGTDSTSSASDEEWTMLNNSLIEADPTPGFGELLTRENWNRLSEVGQLATGELQPIISFMQTSMPGQSRLAFDGISRDLQDVIFNIERAHVPSQTPINHESTQAIFRAFQNQTVSIDRWRIAANSDAPAEINNCKMLFWLNATHQIEQANKQINDPKRRLVCTELAAITRTMAQELIVNNPGISQAPSQVTIRKIGGISTQEHDWLEKRLPRVLEAQKRILDPIIMDRFQVELKKPLKIGLCNSGGGFRAMTYAAGFLSALEKLGIVDSASHVSGLSGSTWFMMRWFLSNPSPQQCKDELKKVIPRANLLHLFANKEKLDVPRLVHDVIIPKAVFHKPISSIDLFGGLLARALLHDCCGEKRHQLTMGDLARSIESGHYPFPICTAISETTLGTHNEKWYNWYEYNPYEVENSTLGLSIPAHAYGNKFQNGSSQYVSLPESLGSLMATWGSAYTINFADNIDRARTGAVAGYAASAAANRILPAGLYKDGRISPAQIHNPWHQLPEDAIAERFESKEQTAAITAPELCTFNDAGIDFNLPLIPLLKRARGLDVILVGDASGSKHIMQEKMMPNGKTGCPKELAKFFHAVERYGILYERKEDGKPQPNFSIYIPQNALNKREPVWIEGEKLPIIIYFNFIVTPEAINQGMEDRELKRLIQENNLAGFDAQACLRSYGFTFNFEYSSEDFKQLAGVAEFNVLSHKEEIMQTLVDAYHRRAVVFEE